jgi:hypothetical protein
MAPKGAKAKICAAPLVVADTAPIKPGANHDLLSELESKMSIIRSNGFEGLVDMDPLDIGNGGTVAFN